MRWKAQFKTKAKREKTPESPEMSSPDPESGPMFDHRKMGDWIYDEEDFNVPMPDEFYKNRKGMNISK